MAGRCVAEEAPPLSILYAAAARAAVEGDHDAGLAAWRSIEARFPDPGDVRQAHALLNQAEILAASDGDPEATREVARRATEAYDRVWGPGPTPGHRARRVLIASEAASGDVVAARQEYARLQAIHDEHTGRAHAGWLTTHRLEPAILAAEGKAQEAAQVVDEVMASAAALLGPSSADYRAFLVDLFGQEPPGPRRDRVAGPLREALDEALPELSELASSPSEDTEYPDEEEDDDTLPGGSLRFPEPSARLPLPSNPLRFRARAEALAALAAEATPELAIRLETALAADAASRGYWELALSALARARRLAGEVPQVTPEHRASLAVLGTALVQRAGSLADLGAVLRDSTGSSPEAISRAVQALRLALAKELLHPDPQPDSIRILHRRAVALLQGGPADLPGERARVASDRALLEENETAMDFAAPEWDAAPPRAPRADDRAMAWAKALGPLPPGGRLDAPRQAAMARLAREIGEDSEASREFADLVLDRSPCLSSEGWLGVAAALVTDTADLPEPLLQTLGDSDCFSAEALQGFSRELPGHPLAKSAPALLPRIARVLMTRAEEVRWDEEAHEAIRGAARAILQSAGDPAAAPGIATLLLDEFQDATAALEVLERVQEPSFVIHRLRLRCALTMDDETAERAALAQVIATAPEPPPGEGEQWIMWAFRAKEFGDHTGARRLLALLDDPASRGELLRSAGAMYAVLCGELEHDGCSARVAAGARRHLEEVGDADGLMTLSERLASVLVPLTRLPDEASRGSIRDAVDRTLARTVGRLSGTSPDPTALLNLASVGRSAGLTTRAVEVLDAGLKAARSAAGDTESNATIELRTELVGLHFEAERPEAGWASLREGMVALLDAGRGLWSLMGKVPEEQEGRLARLTKISAEVLGSRPPRAQDILRVATGLHDSCKASSTPECREFIRRELLRVARGEASPSWPQRIDATERILDLAPEAPAPWLGEVFAEATKVYPEDAGDRYRLLWALGKAAARRAPVAAAVPLLDAARQANLEYVGEDDSDSVAILELKVEVLRAAGDEAAAAEVEDEISRIELGG
jgi:hypothetical protein